MVSDLWFIFSDRFCPKLHKILNYLLKNSMKQLMPKKKGSSIILEKLSTCFCFKLSNTNEQQAREQNLQVIGPKLEQIHHKINIGRAKTDVDFNHFLIISVYNNIESFERRLKMENYFNLEKISQLDCYSQSQMWCYVRQFGQTEEDCKEKVELLITKISESQRDVCQKSNRIVKKNKPFVDSHFQSQFQKQHSQILNKYVENNMELFIHSSQMKHETNHFHQQVRRINSNHTLKSFVEFLEAEEQQCDYTGFVTDLAHEQKVHNFVMTFLQRYDSAVSLPLLRLSREIWHKYNKLEDKDLNQKEIIILATSMTESLMSEAKQIFNMAKRVNRQTVEKLRKFVTFYTTTFLFVIFEFFVNPYYQLQVQLTVKEFQEFQFYLYNQFVFQQSDGQDEQGEEASMEGRKRVKQNN